MLAYNLLITLVKYQHQSQKDQCTFCMALHNHILAEWKQSSDAFLVSQISPNSLFSIQKCILSFCAYQ